MYFKFAFTKAVLEKLSPSKVTHLVFCMIQDRTALYIYLKNTAVPGHMHFLSSTEHVMKNVRKTVQLNGVA